MFQTPTFDEIRDAVLRDTRSLDPTADISADSDHFVHASRLASCAVGQYAHQVWMAQQIFPDTADSEYLERHASLRGLRRRSPTTAAGSAVICGNVGAHVPAGTQIRAGSRFYRTTEAAQIGSDGQTEVPIIADTAGSAANATDTAGQLMAPSAGVSADCRIQAAGGTDTENDASLLSRLLELIRRPPAGGNRNDYKNWALNVDGVTSAYVYPLRRGLGTVDIAVTSAGGMPSDEVIGRVQAYIDEMRPVTAKSSLVFKPDVTTVPVTVQVRTDGIDLPTAKERIETALTEYFNTLIPGDGLIVSQIEAAISNADGIADRRLTSPAANRNAEMLRRIEWFKLGQITVTAM
ncbi:baseplate J/gp47 family protein [Neisseria leonii]|uniref:baseplate J/gp47 family protein n=1 Tax=Neisseria leonii TaxID=2995413 RepID=UPI00237A0E8C|nr:baseplate J/gp47 family protein [Neisseria sp. 3986]MDD9325605.1 baseplate J/gp47 family protein [Neisseria sp. 3986]